MKMIKAKPHCTQFLSHALHHMNIDLHNVYLHNVADDECILAFDINTTKTGLINKEDAVGSLNLHSNNKKHDA